MHTLQKGQPGELPPAVRTGSVHLPDELSTTERATAFRVAQKEAAKAAK
jgi:hypothetical protein